MAIRAASIWRLVIQPRSIAFRPNWPNSTVVPPLAVPAIRPRCCFLCLTLFGRSIVYVLSRQLCSVLGASGLVSGLGASAGLAERFGA